MNNERYNQIIDEAYKIYKRHTHNKNELNGNKGGHSKWGDNPLIAGVQHLTKDSFIQMIKVESHFSKTWGLKIEERELSLEERKQFAINKHPLVSPDLMTNELLNSNNVPTKLITLTYQNEKI